MTDMKPPVFFQGDDDFANIISQKAAYVDKTGLLRELVTRSPKVTLLTRPPRFGKSLTLNMLQNFLEMNYANPEDRSIPEELFQDLDVFKEDKPLCDEYMGRYPVVSISFKGVEGLCFEDAALMLFNILLDLAKKFRFLLNRENIDEYSLFPLKEILDMGKDKNSLFGPAGTLTPKALSALTNFLKDLTSLLHDVYHKQVFLLIDEYEFPLKKAKLHGYYDEMLNIIRGIHLSALKGNSNLYKAIVTGCLRICYQSICSDANNFVCYGLRDAEYSDVIGFTTEEVRTLLAKYGMADRYEDVARWYDGYNISGRQMMCPWSVLHFMKDALAETNSPRTFEPQCYWASTSGNDLINLCLRSPSSGVHEKIQNLLDGKTEVIDAFEYTTYPDISSECNFFDTFALLMYHTGYLTIDPDISTEEGKIAVRIPNEEIRKCFALKAEGIYSGDNPVWVEQAQALTDALFRGDVNQSRKIIGKMLMTFVGIRDTAHYESYYHGFLSGVLGTVCGSDLTLTSNTESGCGYSDIILKRESDLAAVILELKKSTEGRIATMKKDCQEAITQINSMQYDFSIKQDGYSIRKFGIAFWNKRCEILTDDSDAA